MNGPSLKMADIVRSAGRNFIERNRSWLNRLHLKVLTAIERCRTAALGGHLDECRAVDIVPSPSTRAETDTAPSVRRMLATVGSKRDSASFCPHATSMLSSLCPINWQQSLYRINGLCTTYPFGSARRRFSRFAAIHSTWEQT